MYSWWYGNSFFKPVRRFICLVKVRWQEWNLTFINQVLGITKHVIDIHVSNVVTLKSKQIQIYLKKNMQGNAFVICKLLTCSIRIEDKSNTKCNGNLPRYEIWFHPSHLYIIIFYIKQNNIEHHGLPMFKIVNYMLPMSCKKCVMSSIKMRI